MRIHFFIPSLISIHSTPYFDCKEIYHFGWCTHIDGCGIHDYKFSPGLFQSKLKTMYKSNGRPALKESYFIYRITSTTIRRMHGDSHFTGNGTQYFPGRGSDDEIVEDKQVYNMNLNIDCNSTFPCERDQRRIEDSLSIMDQQHSILWPTREFPETSEILELINNCPMIVVAAWMVVAEAEILIRTTRFVIDEILEPITRYILHRTNTHFLIKELEDHWYLNEGKERLHAAIDIVNRGTSGSPTISLVVCHCNEPFSWIEYERYISFIPPNTRLFVAEKCDRHVEIPEVVTNRFSEIHIIYALDETVRGDECSAYINFIIGNYGSFDDYVIFLQGDPQNHLFFSYLTTVLRSIHMGTANPSFLHLNYHRHVTTITPCMLEVERFLWTPYENTYRNIYTDLDNLDNIDRVSENTHTSTQSHSGNIWVDFKTFMKQFVGVNVAPELIEIFDRSISDESLEIDSDTVIDGSVSVFTIQHNLLSTYCCSQFVVNREKLMSHPLEFYQHMLRMVDGGYPDLCVSQELRVKRSSQCYVFEFLWHVIFGEKRNLPLRPDDRNLNTALRSKYGNENTRTCWADLELSRGYKLLPYMGNSENVE